MLVSYIVFRWKQCSCAVSNHFLQYRDANPDSSVLTRQKGFFLRRSKRSHPDVRFSLSPRHMCSRNTDNRFANTSERFKRKKTSTGAQSLFSPVLAAPAQLAKHRQHKPRAASAYVGDWWRLNPITPGILPRKLQTLDSGPRNKGTSWQSV